MGTRHWTQSYADIPAEIDADRFASMVDLLDAALERHASRPAFKAFGQTLSYADVDRLSRSFASYLQNRLGVRQGDRVAVMMPNLLAFPVTLLGIMRAGAVQVNVNPLYTPRELEHQLNDAGVETIVVFNGSTPTLAEVRANTGLKTVITVGVGDASGATLPSPPVDARLGESVSFAEALAQGGGLPLRPVALTGDDLLFLQYTGGTTGLSKGAALSHRNLVANTEQFKAFMPVAVKEGEEVLVTAIPLYHIFALMVSLSYLSVGAENWLVANPRDMDGFVGVLAQARPTVFMGVNTLYGGLLQHPKLGEVDWSRLKIAIAAALPWSGRCPTAGRPSRATSFARATACRKPRRWCRSTRPTSPSSPARPACRCRRPTSSCSTTRTSKWGWGSRERSASRGRR
jgi:long-chain acyl-CoA synthetase